MNNVRNMEIKILGIWLNKWPSKRLWFVLKATDSASKYVSSYGRKANLSSLPRLLLSFHVYLGGRRVRRAGLSQPAPKNTLLEPAAL